ncbi:ABC transporter ATP-binding protein/permease [Streptomyces sp. ST2-7A]|nr:ABC transporter ATP-binding protein/permease [Streptomyces sp. ST2-7A]
MPEKTAVPTHPGAAPEVSPGPAPGPSAEPTVDRRPAADPAPVTARAVLRASRGRAVALALVGLLTTAVELVLPAVLGGALDGLVAGEGTGSALPLCMALIGTAVVLEGVRTVLAGTTDARAAAGLRRDLVGRLLAVGPEATRRLGTGETVTRGTVNAAHAGGFPVALAGLVPAVLTPVGGLVALFLLDPRLALVVLLGAPPLVVLLRSFARSTSDCVSRYQKAQGTLAARLVEALTGARTIAAAGTRERERDRVLEPLTELGRQGHRLWRVQGAASARAVLLVPLLVLGVVAAGGLLVAEGDLGAGELLAAARWAALAAGAGSLVGGLSAVVRARGAARRLDEVRAVEPPPSGDRDLPPGPGAVGLRGVTVVRDGREVLRGVDVELPGGATTAVVGRSGAGKSVLAAVTGGLLAPDAGEVLLDGVPVAELAPAVLRREVGWAFERPASVSGTVADSIGLGPCPPSRERIEAAARAACADGFVRALPKGYDTPCAEAPLSGGESQRIGLARAFAHRGRLLVLDDATSGLDAVTENRVERALAAAGRGRTRLVVAHRPRTAARADRVVWLEDGRVRACGTHAELWADPAYRAVWRG